MVRGERSQEYLYKKAQSSAVLRKMFAVAGSVLFRPVMLPIAIAQRKRAFKLHVTGRENIPKGPAMINIHHQTHQDVATYLEAIGEYTSPLVAIEGGSSSFEWLLLETLDCVATIRGNTDLAGKRRKEAFEEGVGRLIAGGKLLVAGEGTYCPLVDSVLGVYAGGTAGIASAASRALNCDVPLINAMGICVPDDDGNLADFYIDFMKPFDYRKYGDDPAAANGLRDAMTARKREMLALYAPGMTQADFTRFREAQMAKFPTDRDYRENAHFSLNYRLAATAEEKAAVVKMFQDN
jgi:1-acyl-sn-glycerol-3-phosphate acyltransferase